jgi:hypothetical protein
MGESAVKPIASAPHLVCHSDVGDVAPSHKGGRNVLCSRRLHLPKFPYGRVFIVAPYIGVLAYLIFQGRGMAERDAQQAREAREELRRVVGFSAADEIEKLDRLKKAGSISDAEFARLRAKLAQ